MTEPFFKTSRRLSETDAITMYSQATKLDPMDGQSYPPTDTGSTGLDVMKAAKNDGYISAYHHALDFPSVCLYVANVGPAICGINWYDSFDSPDSNGVVKITPNAYVRGGHEPQIQGIDASSRYIRLINSWGPNWGDHGCFQLSFADFERLMNEQGDVTLAVK
jgi:C1A family cysteine protease